MTAQSLNLDTSVDDEDDDDDFLWDEDEFEDSEFPARYKEEFPNWHLMRIRSFNGAKLTDIDDWLAENMHYGKYQRVGWRSGCSSSVGVVIEHGRDAMMFKLRWA